MEFGVWLLWSGCFQVVVTDWVRDYTMPAFFVSYLSIPKFTCPFFFPRSCVNIYCGWPFLQFIRKKRRALL